MTLLSRSNVLRGMFLVFLVSVTASMAGASFTYYNPDPAIGDSVDEILLHYYGTDWQRIEDDPSVGDGDQLWYETDGLAYAQAMYADDDLNFGYTVGQTGGTAGNWIGTEGTEYGVQWTGGASYELQGDPFLRLNLWDATSDDVWSSKQMENPGWCDHMLSFLITGGSSIGNYVIFWEDQSLGDRDYNDLVVELSQVAPIPEPGTLVLLGLGLLGAGFVAVRRRR